MTAPAPDTRRLRLVGDDERAPRQPHRGGEVPPLLVAALGLVGLVITLTPWAVLAVTGGRSGVYLATVGMVTSALAVLRGLARLAPRPRAAGSASSSGGR